MNNIAFNDQNPAMDSVIEVFLKSHKEDEVNNGVKAIFKKIDKTGINLGRIIAKINFIKEVKKYVTDFEIVKELEQIIHFLNLQKEYYLNK